MQEKIPFIIAVSLMLTGSASASSSFDIAVEIIAPIEITRTFPSQINTNQPFDVNLNFSNLVDLELFNISIKETIPAGYKIRKDGIISPRPSYVGAENGATIIYWNISRMANHTSLSLEYSLSAPKLAGNYIFRADASSSDASGNRFAAYNVAKQEVKVRKSPLWQNLLDFFQSLIT